MAKDYKEFKPKYILFGNDRKGTIAFVSLAIVGMAIHNWYHSVPRHNENYATGGFLEPLARQAAKIHKYDD